MSLISSLRRATPQPPKPDVGRPQARDGLEEFLCSGAHNQQRSATLPCCQRALIVPWPARAAQVPGAAGLRARLCRRRRLRRRCGRVRRCRRRGVRGRDRGVLRRSLPAERGRGRCGRVLRPGARVSYSCVPCPAQCLLMGAVTPDAQHAVGLPLGTAWGSRLSSPATE